MLLFAIALSWVGVGIYLWATLTVGWKLIPAVVAVGVGALFMRAAVQTVSRHDERTGQ